MLFDGGDFRGIVEPGEPAVLVAFVEPFEAGRLGPVVIDVIRFGNLVFAAIEFVVGVVVWVGIDVEEDIVDPKIDHNRVGSVLVVGLVTERIWLFCDFPTVMRGCVAGGGRRGGARHRCRRSRCRRS